MTLFINNKFLVTGGDGFLGKHVVENLINNGVPLNNIFIPKSKDFDLRKPFDAKKIVKKDQIVIHLAANVGGLGKGLNKAGDYFYDNAIMALNLIKIGNDVGIKKFIGVGSILQYPENIPIPYEEKKIFSGCPSGITAPYGLGKNVMLNASQFFQDQYKFNSINLILPNLYGPGDDFNPSSSHVVSSLIYKINEAKMNNYNSIKVWGDGSASREFMFVKDAAEAIFLVAKYKNKKNILNIGSGIIITIKELLKTIIELMDYSGNIEWDKQKQVGKKINQLDVNLAIKEINFKSRTTLKTGIKETLKWYYKNIHLL